jgi:predicted transcriptional regulator
MILKLDPALKAALVQQAEQTQTSLSAVARLALRAGLASQQQPAMLQPEVHHGL